MNIHYRVFGCAAFIAGLFLASQAAAKVLYVDNSVATDCIGNYSIANRNCSGAGVTSYNTVQEAVNNCSPGDTVYMRGGTYREIDIDIPNATNGSGWNEGSFTTLASYPGEWAIIDGSGLNTNTEYRYQHVIRHPTSYVTGGINGATKYWLFERFEVTGGRWAFWLTGGPMIFRYLYIHDNGRAVGDDLVGGMFIFTATENIIEYCHFENNEIPGSPTGNNGNLMFDGDYRDTGGNGDAFQPNASVHKNIVRYNLVEGSVQGIRLKGDQRFGYNDRNPNAGSSLWVYKDFGDNIHHNIILNARDVGLRYAQDFSQIHHNILNTNGQVIGKSDGHPVLYNQVIYNNTFKGSGAQYILRSAADSSSYDNYYDSGSGNPEAHIHVWVHNNIQSGYTGTRGAFRMQSDCDNDNWSATDVVFENNLLNNISSSGNVLRMGNTSSGTGCAAEYYTVSAFNECSGNSWRGGVSVINWDVDGSLFLGSFGADQYIANGTFGLGGSLTAGNAGKGGAHPYLDGITLPSYIGATNPTDHVWVNGVLENLSSVDWLKRQGGDPDWSESGDFRPTMVKGFRADSSF